MEKLTPKQLEISKLIEPALVGQKLPLESCESDESGNPLIKPNKVVTKKAVQAIVQCLFPDDQPEPG